MALEHLWAGWRAGFVSEAPRPDCVFCAILDLGQPDTETHILWRHPHGLAFAVLNAYPYTSGHLMVVPTRHVAELEELTGDESAAVWSGLAGGVIAIKRAYRPDGLNLGVNLGRVAGAGIPGHFHIHALPRWNGDTNFMTAVATTRVIPESLPDTYAKLRAAWPEDPPTPGNLT
jgi:ATP adenylyltransferase